MPAEQSILAPLFRVPSLSNLATPEDRGNEEGDGSCEQEDEDIEESWAELGRRTRVSIYLSAFISSPFAPLCRGPTATSEPFLSPLELLPPTIVEDVHSVGAFAAAMIGTLMPSWHFTTAPSGFVNTGPDVGHEKMISSVWSNFPTEIKAGVVLGTTSAVRNISRSWT